ncbi:unnamed protein product [Symbiodinium sp. CCMP2592]|nr:unnamed protein product [Symbiodinium sp. CCMP2592]
MAGFLQEFLCEEDDKQLDCDEASATLPASSPQKGSPKKVAGKPAKQSPKSSAKTRPPSFGGRGKDTKKRAVRGTMGTFAGRRLPPTPDGAAQFVRIRDAYYKMKAENGKPRISINQADFWQKMSSAEDFGVALAKYVQLHWSKSVQ